MHPNVIDYLIHKTPIIAEKTLKEFSSQGISEALNLSRSTVSGYLNKYFKDGILLKIKSYPVVFLHKETFSQSFFEPQKNEYNSLAELLQESNYVQYSDALESVIGSKGSLREQIGQIKTAVLYPGKGLPILLLGPSGSGKTFLAEKIFDYMCDEKQVVETAPFISYNCAQYFNNPELLSSVLFGHVKGAYTGADEAQAGLLEKADGGVLFLDEVHRLSEEGQEKLFTFMDSGHYSPIGDNSIQKKSFVRLIFATTEDVHSTFLPTFIRRLPVIIHLPKFQDRPQKERLSLIDNFFINESKIFEQTITVSSRVIDLLLRSSFEGNVGKIRNTIKYACGNAFTRSKQRKEISIRLQDLPTDAKTKSNELAVTYGEDKARKYTPQSVIHQYSMTNLKKNIYDYFYQLIRRYEAYKKGTMSVQILLEEEISHTVFLMDELAFKKGSIDEEESLFTFLVMQIRATFNLMQENYGFTQDGNKVIAIAHYLYVKENENILISHQNWAALKTEMMQFFDENLGDAFWLSKRLVKQLATQLDIDLLEEDILLIAFYLYSQEMGEVNRKIKGFVLAHGYSTASSMANVANRLLKNNMFQAYDMPIDITLDEVETQVIKYMDNYPTEPGLILLVDMGSLNQLGRRLVDKLKGPLIIIDFVSTPIVLEVGQLILSGKSIAEIYEKIETRNIVTKEIVYPKLNRKKALITCCYTGLGSARQIQDILKKTIGKRVEDLQIIAYDFESLQKNKLQEVPFEMYDVLAIVGTVNPEVPRIPYIGMDRLITGEYLEDFLDILKHHFEIADTGLKEDLVFNFSTKRIVENLTILDAEKLLNLIQIALKEIEKNLNVSFEGTKQFLFYLHTASMVERILRKQTVDKQEDLKDYLENHKETIETIHHAFFILEKNYSIKIEDQELRLVNDIIMG
ncbi:sigma 54-interacting transcriptional regulator [Enterococcus sp. LJL99]